jgi:hypothetical protein
MQLVLSHAALSGEMELLIENLKRSELSLEEAQRIALLGRWDLNPANMEQSWSNSLYDLLELDRGAAASPDLFLSLVHRTIIKKSLIFTTTFLHMTSLIPCAIGCCSRKAEKNGCTCA